VERSVCRLHRSATQANAVPGFRSTQTSSADAKVFEWFRETDHAGNSAQYEVRCGIAIAHTLETQRR